MSKIWYNKAMSRSTTNELTQNILETLFTYGIFAWRQNTTGVVNPKTASYRSAPKVGIPDILAIMPPDGRLLCVEVKTGKDRLRPEQTGFLATASAKGAYCIVAKDIDQFKQDLFDILPK